MKKDNLERFVRDNREAFDDRELRPSSPGNDLWQRIESGLDKQLEQSGTNQIRSDSSSPFQQIHKNSSRTEGLLAEGFRPNRPIDGWLPTAWSGLSWRVAASIVVLLLAGSFFYMNSQYGVAHQPEIVAADPRYAKAVVQYTQLIDDKRAELKQMTEGNPALYREFATDLDRLEKSYQSLKADLPKNPNQDVLIKAMIQNLNFQIELLNQQLHVIQRINRQTHENPV
ncbi:MAG: hypothetical protein JWP57_401 [Spirosoma sp.]|nr:hypothetical protein [Spirosoma sp.]